jgi:hypothetical protein
MTPRARAPVSLQLTLTPSDLEEVRFLLPHQLRIWGGQVDEVLCLVDVPPWKQGREETTRSLGEVGEFLEDQRRTHPHLRWGQVDYSAEAVRRVETTFYGGHSVPIHDYRCRPIYGYLYLLLAPLHDLVLHIDCDMMFGGGSQTWVGEAVEQLGRRPELLACNPLPGPPRPDGRLLSQRHRHVAEPGTKPAYRFQTLSYRVFLLDRRAFAERLAPLRSEWPPLHNALRALLRRRRRPHALLEQVITGAMLRRGQFRLDFLGTNPGMWSLHPRFRTGRFKRALPRLIQLIEAQEVHRSQLGEYDLTEGMLAVAESFENSVTTVTPGAAREA